MNFEIELASNSFNDIFYFISYVFVLSDLNSFSTTIFCVCCNCTIKFTDVQTRSPEQLVVITFMRILSHVFHKHKNIVSFRLRTNQLNHVNFVPCIIHALLSLQEASTAYGLNMLCVANVWFSFS